MSKKGINVVSLFDGISCGQLALDRAGIIYNTYYASEIDKYATKVTQQHYPNTIQLGDVREINFQEIKDIDILMGGSPCQDLSVYKYDRGGVNGLEGKKSNLFYQFERAFKESNPEYFLLENVPMEKQWEDIITETLGVSPIKINSSLVCAAERKRLYWTNIPVIGLPEDKQIFLKNVVLEESEVPAKYWYNIPFIYNGQDKKVEATLDVQKGFMRNMKECYNLNSKCNTLLADGSGGNRQKKIFQNGKCRKLTPLEYERLQTIPDNYTECLSDSRRYTAIGNGWTVDVISWILSFLPNTYKN